MYTYLHESPLQRIALRRDLREGLQLLLDDMVQFSEATEHRYHEGLVVVPMLFCQPRCVFIAGGGDGLALTRLLRFACVEQVILCDYDKAVTDLATEHADLVALNEGSMSDPRVTVLNEDAYAFIERTDQQFDLAICDFPDPWFPDLDRVYSVEFYERLRDRLAPGGVVVVQTRPTPVIAPIVRATVGAVFPHHTFYMATGTIGATLASTEPLERRYPVPEWTRFLDEDRASACFALGKDGAVRFSPDRERPNREDLPHLFRMAVTEVCAPRICTPYLYRRGYLWVRLGEPGSFSVEMIDATLQGLCEMAGLVVAVSERYREIWDPVLDRLGFLPSTRSYTHLHYHLGSGSRRKAKEVWEKYDDGSVASIDVTTCAPSQNMEIRELLQRYLAEHSQHLFDVPHSRLDMDRIDWYAITRDPEGRPLTLYQGLVTGSTVQLEIIYSVGSHRQTVLSGALLFTRLHEMGVRFVGSYAPNPAISRYFEQMGARPIDELHIRIHPDSQRPDEEDLPEGSVLEAALREMRGG